MSAPKVTSFRFPSKNSAVIRLFWYELLRSDALKTNILSTTYIDNLELIPKRRGDDPAAVVSSSYHVLTFTCSNTGEHGGIADNFFDQEAFQKFARYLIK